MRKDTKALVILVAALFSVVGSAAELSIASRAAENNWTVMKYLTSLGRQDKGKKLKGVKLPHPCIGVDCGLEGYALRGFTYLGKVNVGDVPVNIHLVEGHESIRIAYIWPAESDSRYYLPSCQDVEKASISKSDIYPFYDESRPSLNVEVVESLTCIPAVWESALVD